MKDTYLKNRHFIEIKNGVRKDSVLEFVELGHDDPLWLLNAKQMFNSIVSEDYFAVIADYDNGTYTSMMA